MTPVSQLELLSLTLYGFLLGIVLAFILDLFRFFRIFRNAFSEKFRKEDFKGFKNKEGVLCLLLIFFEDVTYGVIASAVTAVALFNINNGVPRWFILLGTAFGFFAYRTTLGKAVTKLNTAFAKIAVKIGFALYSATVLRLYGKMRKAVCKLIENRRNREIVRECSALEARALEEAKKLFGMKIENIL